MNVLRILVALSAILVSCGGDTSSGQNDDGLRSSPDTSSTPQDMGTSAQDGSTTVDASSDLGRDVRGDECVGDSDCQDAVFCNGIERCFQGVCFPSPTPRCSDPSACTQDLCDEANQLCEYRPDDSLCAPGQVCNSKAGCFTPAQCALDSDCDDALLCNGAERCVNGECEPGTPVACDDGVSCTADTCVEGTGECQTVSDHARCLVTELCVLGVGCSPRPPCMGNDDCDDGLYCNGTETCGVDGVCVPGAPPVAVDTVSCTIDQCSETLNMVVNTPDNARCSDGAFCNGAEVCHPVDGCGPGAPPVLSDGVACTSDVCNEALNFIEHAPDDAACDDGLFCNGPEVCHPIDDCSPGEPPLLTDGVGCTLDTCSEIMDAVLHVADDSLCNDGLFCNGVETCDAVNDCQTGTVPNLDDGFLCTTDICDEGTDTVLHSPVNSVCDDGNACNGVETCSATFGCQTGTPAAVDDGVGCTVDACDPVTGISHTPDNASCNDMQYCNGVEFCHPTNDCMDGPNPSVDDGDPCTFDSCNEATDMSVHVPGSNGTVCGSGLICLTGVCGASFCGDGFPDSSRGEQCDDGGTVGGDGCDSNCQLEVSSCDSTGVWNVSPTVSFSCLSGLIAVDVPSTLSFIAGGAVVNGATREVLFGGAEVMALIGAGAQCPAGNFSAAKVFTGACTETYSIVGSFTGPNSWNANFMATFTGGAANCGDCVTTSFPISGSR